MATKKTGVGIWCHYRTSERPAADGLIFDGLVGDDLVEAKLYWAPIDWSHPDRPGKQAYMVVRIFRGKMNCYGRYDSELRWAGYVDDGQYPRRNWTRLTAIAEGIGVDELSGYIADTIWYHETMLSIGCRYERGHYVFPQGVHAEEIQAQLRDAWIEHTRDRVV